MILPHIKINRWGTFVISIFVLLCLSLTTVDAQPTPKKPKQKKEKRGKKEKHSTLQVTPVVTQDVEMQFVDACTEIMLGNSKGAIDIFQQILKIQPSHHASVYNLAQLYMEKSHDPNMVNEAILMGEQALRYDDNNYWYYAVLVEAYKKKSDYQNAIRIQSIITQKYPKEIGVFPTLADLYVKSKQPEKAIAVFKQIESKGRLSEELLVQKYKTCVDIGNEELAMETINRLIELSPDKPEYYYNKHKLYSLMNKNQEGVAFLKNLLVQFPNDSYALLTLADYYKSINNLPESDKYLFLAFANADIPVEGKLNVIQSLGDMGNEDPSVIARIQKLMQLVSIAHPDHAISLLIKGDNWWVQNRPDSAYIYYKKAVQKEPTRPDFWEKFLASSMQFPNIEVFYQDVSNGLEYFPNQDKFTYYWGEANLLKKDYKQAISAFEKVKRRGHLSAIWMARTQAGLGAAIMNSDKPLDAAEYFQKALELAGEDAFVQSRYSIFLSTTKKEVPQAKQIAENIIAKAPQLAEGFVALAVALYQSGDYNGALAQIEKAIAVKPHAEFYERKGDILTKLGKNEEALSQWKKSKELGNSALDITQKNIN